MVKKIINCPKCLKKEVVHYARGLCRSCYRKEPDQRKKELKYVANYRSNNKEWYKKTYKTYNFKRMTYIKEKNKERYELNKESLREKRKKYYYENRFKELENKRLWDYNNRHKINTYRKKRYVSDFEYKLLVRLRSRILKVLKNNKKQDKTIGLLGCTIKKAKEHIESKFVEGMSWDNHGEWHIDHIKPCSSFDLSTYEGQKMCFHYTNLQPLWAKDNMSKGAKIYWQNRKI